MKGCYDKKLSNSPALEAYAHACPSSDSYRIQRLAVLRHVHSYRIQRHCESGWEKKKK